MNICSWPCEPIQYWQSLETSIKLLQTIRTLQNHSIKLEMLPQNKGFGKKKFLKVKLTKIIKHRHSRSPIHFYSSSNINNVAKSPQTASGLNTVKFVDSCCINTKSVCRSTLLPFNSQKGNIIQFDFVLQCCIEISIM